MTSLNPMSTAPRDATIIVVWHKETGKPMAAYINAKYEVDRGLVDFRGLWSYFVSDEMGSPPGMGFVREKYLAGWCHLPKMPAA